MQRKDVICPNDVGWLKAVRWLEKSPDVTLQCSTIKSSAQPVAVLCNGLYVEFESILKYPPLSHEDIRFCKSCSIQAISPRYNNEE
jgi:hypothetical protein